MIAQKRCFRCGETQPLSEFYSHPRMKDGHLNKCKECARKDIKANRTAKRGQYSEYDRQRNQRPERRSAKREMYSRARENNPQKIAARSSVRTALEAGRIDRQPCKFCGDPKSEAHHEDYSKPLDVVWVCFKCHREKFHGQVVVGLETA